MVKNPPAKAGDAQDLVRSLSQEDPPEVTMAAHSSILAWEIPWTEEPAGLQSTGLQRDMTERARTHVTHLKTCGEGRSQGKYFYCKRRKRKKEKKKRHKKSLGGDEYFCSLDCGNGIVGIYVCVQTPKINILKMHDLGDVPGGPVTKPSHFQSRGLGFDPWSGN